MEEHNWICKCPEQWVVPSEFRMCDRCKATAPQAHRMDKKFRIIKLEKHGISIDSFTQSYFDRQNNGLTKHLFGFSTDLLKDN